ncbi:MAG TPA: hypothetical protein VIM59_15040, partial [Cellvibrio sp.]
MAAEKKKTSEKKAVAKKPAKKAAAKAPVKKGKKKLAATDLVISVPRGGQVIQYFNLTPALPTDTGRGDWIFTEDGSTQDIETLTVGFAENPLPLEREL